MSSEVAFALETADWPALLVDAAGTICRANGSATRFFGPALAGPNARLAAIWSPDNPHTAEDFLAHWNQSPTPIFALKFALGAGQAGTHLTAICVVRKDGKEQFLIQFLPVPQPVAGEVDRPAAEAALAQKQKLECALQLARTVALDFNNALTSILGHTSLLLSKTEPAHPWRSSLIEVEKSAARAAEVASDLAAFSRQEKETRPQTAGNLNALLQRTVELFQQKPGPEPIEWALQLERKLFLVKFDEAKMQQVFMRILENSVQALRGRGHISVHSRNLELTAPTQDRDTRLAAGAYVCVEIADNGCGIPAEVLPRIFEPFFTTKGDRGHRGLGLAWVYGIVTNHGGGVAVSSQPGTGTSVRVYLPVENKVLSSQNVPVDDLTGSETILMVDDEDLLLTMGETILSAYGYRVLTANSGQKALDLLSKSDIAVDLMITDLVMAAMSGRELVEHVRALLPGTRILCTSGYVRPNNPEDDQAYLQKPFTSQELLLKVKQVLSAE